MRTKIIALAVLLAVQSHAQTLLSYTNVRADVSGGPAFSATAIAGPLRITYVVEDTPGVPLNLDDGTTFRLEAWAADGVRVQNVASTNLVNTDLSAGQVRFTVPSLGAGEYRIRGVAQPAGGDTTLVWQITHHMLTITSAPSASASISVTSTNVIDLGNLTVQWEIQGDGDLAPDSTDRTIVPHTDLGASLGKTNERFAEAHIDEGYFGTIRAGTVDVETAVGFLDNTKVQKTGETNAVDLTNAEVRVRTPVNPPDAVNKGYVDAVAGGTTNIGTVQLYSNAFNQVGFYNRLGYWEPIRESGLPTTDWTVLYNFDGPEEIASWSNLNVTGSAWKYYVTNGALHIIGPNESATARFFGLIPITSGVASRCAMRILEPLQYPVWVNGNYGYGLAAYDSGLTNTAFHARRVNSLGEALETYIFNRSFSESQDTRYIAPYTAGSAGTAYTYLWGWRGITMYGDFDGVKTLRFYLSNTPNEAPALQYRTTNAAPVIGWSILAQCSSGAAGVTNSGPFIIDWYGATTGALWSAAW